MLKFEPLVFELLGVYILVLTLLSFPYSFMVVLKPKSGLNTKWRRLQVDQRNHLIQLKIFGGVNTTKL